MNKPIPLPRRPAGTHLLVLVSLGISIGTWGPLGSLRANGVLRDGYGAGSMAMGGTGVAFSEDPLTSLGSNPATLSLLDRPTFSMSLTGIYGEADFDHAFARNVGLGEDSGLFPEMAWAYPVRDTPFTLGMAIKVDSARLADWEYLDAPGGVDGGTSYGVQTHRSEFLAVSATVGAAVELGPRFTAGLAVGLVHHRIGLEVPFIFQSQATLAGWKTLLDMETEGYGWMAALGFLYQFNEDVAFGLSYLTEAKLHGEGRARGDVSAQLDSLGLTGVPSGYGYDAEVQTALPQVVSGGFSWQWSPRIRVAAQVDWIGWESAFDSLEVTLEEGSNASINGLVGSSALRDDVPIGWRDRLVYRAGMEAQLTPAWAVRLGYSYGRSPVPASLTTPLNGSTFEHTLTAGTEIQSANWSAGLAYQYHLPNGESVNRSAYRSGEYSGTALEVSAHLLTLSLRRSF